MKRGTKITLWMTVGMLATLIALGAIGAAVAPPQPVVRVPAATAAPAAAPATVATGPADTRICKVTATDRGAYYLDITSAQGHNFTACGDGPEAFGSDIGRLLGQPRMDRRCILPVTEPATAGADTAPTDEALVGVYSDTTRKDLADARDYCRSLGGTN